LLFLRLTHSAADKDTLLYCLGLNLAGQLPKDLKQLVNKEELALVMKGVVAMMLETETDPGGMLATNGESLNVMIQERAASLQEKVSYSSIAPPSCILLSHLSLNYVLA